MATLVPYVRGHTITCSNQFATIADVYCKAMRQFPPISNFEVVYIDCMGNMIMILNDSKMPEILNVTFFLFPALVGEYLPSVSDIAFL